MGIRGQVAYAVLLAALPVPALAYIDPGAGSAIASAIVALFVGISVAVKGYWYKLKSMLLGSSRTGTPAKVDEQTGEEGK